MAEGKLRDNPGEPHRCDERCTCPVHGTPLIYWPAGDDHACQDASCAHGHGMNDWADDVGDLYILEESPPPPLTRPAYDLPLDDPRHRCVQGLCDDHAGKS